MLHRQNTHYAHNVHNEHKNKLINWQHQFNNRGINGSWHNIISISSMVIDHLKPHIQDEDNGNQNQPIGIGLKS